ncbi:coproporphyrinogen III oxidase [Sulfitobacter sp. M220]|uniref:radical SAM family heme chaperone HemW n=1 Tax=Sulfitobacter TaxID=60136 RepID=UPI001B441EF2|nr:MULTISPECIES: radical SAM family heme chaperone HemW [unclassified Sulfitobacter]MBQ0716118.1 coproporphyrinogen III oxidase [Sulfitobacter litoralis]MBQ0801088.1 coproporphyrinogen III oxidase [Sulfitobacter litoralis]MCF7727397.1 coproporphyrinogen III oxidase [Sulfitobacter sp. M22]MCF7778759.1 coproporphyrinogen III oxidase [Sulfitobacter sp. M220]
MTEDWRQGGFGLYIHWPFCEAKCPYCDFNSHVSRSIDQRAWRDAYLSELERGAAETQGRVLNAVFFGGGTPSLMDPDVVADVIAAIRRLWPTANDLEITLEANPGSVEADRFAAFRQAGVNRISMGIQALNDADLKRLGRIHTIAEGLAAFDIARTTFDRVSFDLIYGRQNQTLADWQTELKQALSLAIDHMSLYQLTIEQGTAFGDRYAVGKLRGLPTDDLGADMYAATQDICGEMGMPSYEVSNHARDGAQSRHNLIYWRYGDYLGIGPGAHGRLTQNGNRFATECFSNPKRWLDASVSGATEKPRELLTTEDQGSEFLMMGLRLKEGVDLRRYEALAGAPLSTKKITQMQDIGMISRVQDQLFVTDQGFMVLNAILAELLSD